MDDLIEALKLNKGNLIFDAGSGTGNLCLRLKKFGSKPVRFDFSTMALSIHKKNYQDGQVVLGDLTQNLPFSNNCFNKVVSNNVLFTINISLRLAVMKEFYRILKPYKTVVVANIHSEFNSLSIIINHLKLSKQIKGLRQTAIDFYKKVYAVIKMLYYSWLLIEKNKHGRYSFIKLNEQKYLLSESIFNNVFETIYAYSNQSYLDVGIKF